MSGIVEYIHKDSFIHRLNPITKVLWTLAVLLLAFMFKQPSAIFVLFISNLLIAVMSGIFKQLLPVIKGLFIFSLLLILFQIFFITDGKPLFFIIPYLKLGCITDEGIRLSLIMSLRMMASLSPISILMMTTPMTDIVIVMVDKLKIPFKYAFMFITALRFIPTFMDEMDLILQAQMSRGYNSDTKNPFKKLVIIIPLAIPLLVSAIKKTEKIAISMEVRGFASGPRSSLREIAMNRIDYAAISFMLFIVTTFTILLSKF